MTRKLTRTERVAATKERIQAVAGELFAAQGFDSTGVRDIAREAGVDPATVIRYFGSKEGLFLTSMTLPDTWGEVLSGPLESLAADYVRLILDQSQHPEGGAILAALVRSSERPEVAEALRNYTQQIFEARIQPRLAGEDAATRARLFAAGLTGLQIALWVSVDEVLAATPTDDLIRLYAPSLQLLLTPTLPPEA